MKRLYLPAVMLLILSGCGIFGGDRHLGKTLADLPPAVLPSEAEPLKPATLDQIEESYRAALDVATEPQLRHRILVRLADIEMARSEDRQLTEAEERQHFADAIAMYDELLVVDDTEGADSLDDERLLYRLSKAYALDGRMQESDAALARLVSLYPNSPYAAEAEFRRAEHAFNQGDYQTAEALYRQVVEVGESTPFYLNAVYMLGWSQFKANEFRRGISAFTEVLDRLMPEDQNLEVLNSSSRGLLEDTLRVMAITFTYLEGAQSITEVYRNLGERHYQHMIYRRLGQWYLEKELYSDAADTYTHFIQAFPNSVHGPDFAVARMEVYKQGGFADEILPSKEQFVRQYGVTSGYWQSVGPEQRESVKPYLETFLDELSSYYHAEGQSLVRAAEEYQRLFAAGRPPKVRPDPPQASLLTAADYYQQYINTFPDSPRLAEMTFLKAEAQYEAGDLAGAVSAYENVAYELLDEQRGASAGYAAIVTLQQLRDSAEGPVVKAQWQQHKIRSAINFADYYPQDERAVTVLTEAAQDVFNSGDQTQAVAIAKRIAAWQPSPNTDLLKSAWLIIAHSEFDAADYANAEQSYRQVLALSDPEDPSRKEVVERIAATLFKAAEQKAQAGELAAAVEQLLQIDPLSPGSELAIRAQYDAGNYLLEMQEWARAERIFVDFQQRFPQHQLTTTLAPKMAMLYQELEEWDKAAAALAMMASSGNDPETRRQSLYLSAELYQKSNRLDEAALRFAEYVQRYPQPFDLAVEARYQLWQIAEQTNNNRSRDRWMRDIIAANRRAGKQRTERSRYLAAAAANEFADRAFKQFERIRLTLPIKKSLRAKKDAMDETLKAYKEVLDYGVAEFSTQANYRIGTVYSQLSRDLMNSERPKGLDDLAMEQYEILLEEQAYPFEEKSVELLQANAERAWDGLYDDWVKRSFKELARILPARYGKQEKTKEVSRGLR